MATFNNGESGLSIRTKLNNVMQHADGSSSALVLNDAGGDVDIRMEAVGQPNAFFLDGGTSNIGIGTGTPAAKLSVIINDANSVSMISDGDLQLYNSAAPTRAYTFLSKNVGSSMVGGNLRLNDSVTTGTHVGYSSGTDQRGGAGIVFTNHTLGASNYGETIFVRSNDTNDDTWQVLESARINSSGNFIVTGNAQINQGLVVDTSTLVVDATNNRVGIGTATPGRALEIRSVSETIRSTTANGVSNFTSFYDDAGRRGYFGYGGATEDMTLANERTGFLRFITDGSARMTIASNGFIGINNTSPTERLHVTGSIITSANVYSNKNILKTTTGQLEVQAGDTASFYDTDFTDLTTADAGVRFFRNTNTTGSTYIRLHRGDGTAAVDAQFTSGNNISFLSATSAATLGVGTAAPGAKLDVNASTSTPALRVTQLGTGNALEVNDSTLPDTSPFVITAAGDVGIGTSSPNSKLTISGDANVVGISTSIAMRDSTTRRITSPGGGNNGTGGPATTTGAIAITLPVGYTNHMVRFTIKVFDYATNETFEVVVAGYNGSTGSTWGNCSAYIISNNATDRDFTVRFGFDTVSSKCIVYIGELTSVWNYPQVNITDAQIGYTTAGLAAWGTDWSIGFEASAFQNVTRTLTNNRVGARLFGAGQTTADLTDAGARSNLLRLSASGTGAGVGGGIVFASSQADTADSLGMAAIKGLLVSGASNTTGDLAFSTRSVATDTNLTERMRITSTGNIGIGTSVPAAQLHVASGSIRIGTLTDANNVLLDLYAGTNEATRFVRYASGTGEIRHFGTTTFQVVTHDAARLILGTSNTERIRISAAGDVAIGGTIEPVMPLDVNGDTLCRGIEYNIQPTQTSIAAAATLTIAQLLTKIIQYTGAVANLTLPTGTLIEGGIHASSPNNTSFDFSVINTGSGAATLLTATGLTLVGSMVVTNGTSALFRVRKTATNTFTVYRLA